jgi:hypothetical protein
MEKIKSMFRKPAAALKQPLLLNSDEYETVLSTDTTADSISHGNLTGDY